MFKYGCKFNQWSRLIPIKYHELPSSIIKGRCDKRVPGWKHDRVRCQYHSSALPNHLILRRWWYQVGLMCAWQGSIWLASTATIPSDHKRASFRDWASHGQFIRSRINQDQLLPAATHLATKPAGYLGVRNHPMYPIPIHLWEGQLFMMNWGWWKTAWQG